MVKKNVKHPSINELVAVFTEYRAGLITCKQALTQLKCLSQPFQEVKQVFITRSRRLRTW